MSLLIGQILPYITITLFVLGVLYRLGRWAGARIVHNITLSPWSTTGGQVVGNFILDGFLFRKFFKFDLALWLGAILMHFALLNVLGGHIVGFGLLGQQFALIPGLGITPAASEQMSDLLGSIMGILLLITLLYLLLRRFAIKRVQLVTKPSDNVWLVFLLAVVVLGDIMRFFPAFHVPYQWVHDYIGALITFQPVVQLQATINLFHNPLFVLHFLLVQILLIIFPFSKLMHVFGMFAERYIVNKIYRDPAPGLPNIDVAAARRAGLGVPSGDAAAEEVG